MGPCSQEEEILNDLDEKIRTINRDLGKECIKYTIVDPGYLDMLADNESSVEFDDDNKATFDDITEEYRNFVIDELFGGDRDRFSIYGYDKREIKYDSEDSYREKASHVLHRDFDNSYAEYTWNIIGYQKLEGISSCEKAGTGIVYLKEEGGRQYCQDVILPAFEGLIIAMRDSCFYHYSPKLDFIPGKPVDRVLIRTYVSDMSLEGTPYEPDYHELLKLCTGEKNLKRLRSRRDNKLIPLLRPRPERTLRSLSREPIYIGPPTPISPRDMPLPPLPDRTLGTAPTYEELVRDGYISDKLFSPLSLSYPRKRKTSPRKRKTSPRKRKTSPRKRKTFANRRRNEKILE